MKTMRATARFTGKTIEVGTKTIKKPISSVINGWKYLPPTTKRWTYRVAGGLILIHTLDKRTVPGAKKYLDEKTKEFFKDTVETVVDLPDKIVKVIAESTDRDKEWLIWLVCAFAAIGGSVYFWKKEYRPAEPLQTV